MFLKYKQAILSLFKYLDNVSSTQVVIRYLSLLKHTIYTVKETTSCTVNLPNAKS